MQETVSDNKYDKNLNSDGLRDEYRAASVAVYDYYPFGMLMPGRVMLDTAGRCITETRLFEEPVEQWLNCAGQYIGGLSAGATAFGNASVNTSSTYSNGIRVNGSSGGMTLTISGIPVYYITLKLYFHFLAGMTQVKVYSGTGTAGVQLASANVSYTSPATTFALRGVGGYGLPGDLTVAISTAGTASYEQPVDLFSLDSIGYSWITWSVHEGLFTQCGTLTDKYEFGYNGQMKSNEIAGVGNHLEFKFREDDPRIGRFWSIDPLRKQYPWNSPYSFAENDPTNYVDLEGLGKPDKPSASDVKSDKPVIRRSNGGAVIGWVNKGKDPAIHHMASSVSPQSGIIHLYAHANYNVIGGRDKDGNYKQITALLV